MKAGDPPWKRQLKILLDICAFLWVDTDEDRLSSNTAGAIASEPDFSGSSAVALVW